MVAPAARSCTHASARATTAVRATTENAPPVSHVRSFQSTWTGCSGLPALM